jgi:branched-chain amino acid transport system ATP-binding protein
VLLELRGVHKAYGAVPVIRGLDLQVRAGELVGVIGPNGAGKSTAFGLVAGHLACDRGSVWFEGRDLTRATADERCRAGIGRTFQIPQPFGGMTVFENALVASSWGAGLRGAEAAAAARKALATCGLLALADAPAASLRLLERKRLEVARALATGPRLLLLDEVGGGLTDAETHELVTLVQEVHARGVTVLWIEHLVHTLVSAVRRLVVLGEGQVMADGLPHEVVMNRAVRDSYLGSDFDLADAMDEEPADAAA